MPEQPWQPERIPTQSEMLARGLRATAQRPAKLLAVQRRALRQTVDGLRPSRGGQHVRESVPAMLNQLRTQAPRTVFNQRISQHRRFAFGSTSLSEARAIKTAFDCTVNDVVLAACASMLRSWLLERDALPAQPLVAMVPVSVRGDGPAALGNQVSSMAAVLHTDEPDPVVRLRKIHESMSDQKIVQAALPVEAQLEMLTHVPAMAMSQAMRMTFRTRLSERMMPFNLTISNVPGPQMPLYLDGAEQLASYPYSTITDGMALNITVTSYNGHLDWGIVVDREIVQDPWAMYAGIEEALAELLDLAAPTADAKTAAPAAAAPRRAPKARRASTSEAKAAAAR